MDGEAAVGRTQDVAIMVEELRKRTLALGIVGNGVQPVEAGNFPPSGPDQMTTHIVRTVLELSCRSKHTPKEVGYVGHAPQHSYPGGRHHTGGPHPAPRTTARRPWRCATPASAHLNNMVGMAPLPGRGSPAWGTVSSSAATP
jgi:hypothetical protein